MGTVLNIQRYCTDDGPGIRTTVFLKGCPLRCLWCHNPETQSGRREIFFDRAKCISCGRCVIACGKGVHTVMDGHAIDRKKCIGCGACASVCPTGALELCGREISVADVVAEAMRDKPFYEASGGGVTISGGEPLFQPKFTAEILQTLHENGIHTAVETCGFAKTEDFFSVIGHCDLLLFDIKETDPTLHKTYTGVLPQLIHENLRLADEMGVPMILRAPIIPGLNDREDHFAALKALADTLHHCKGVQIMPYHRTGTHKYALLGIDYSLKEISQADTAAVDAWKAKVLE